VVEPTVDPLVWLGKHLEEADTDLLREMLRTFIQHLMSAQADAICGAPYGERSSVRVNHRNVWGASIQITALSCASSRSAVLVSRRSRRLIGPRGRARWLPECPHPSLEHTEPKLEYERLRPSRLEGRAGGHRASLERPRQARSAPGPRWAKSAVHRVIRLDAPHASGC
jgi:Transposase, Mutator family